MKRTVLGSLSLIAAASAVFLTTGGEALWSRATGRAASSRDNPAEQVVHRSDSNQRGQRALRSVGRHARSKRDPVAGLSEQQRAFVQPTLDALDARLTSPSSHRARAAMVAYRQRLIERASGISSPMKDGE